MNIRKQFNDDYDSSTYDTFLDSENIVQQNAKQSCDINSILAKYMKTGVLEHVKSHAPVYADVSNIDYRGAYDSVLRAESAFNALPSSLRKKLDNDPARFVDWMIDSSLDVELKREYGLLNPVKSTDVPADAEEVVPDVS